MGLLSVHNARTPSVGVVSDSEKLAFPEGLNNTMLDDGSYPDNIDALASGNADGDSWHEVTKTVSPLRYACVCSQSFDSKFARTLHL